ncbi:MAG: PQQ-binding-like beta-propeller repeat protein [Planctomycetes bacterium]|nr:PQQ-binding-like beta-propeller repeat protein [Planctomycetota bacterium]
MLRFAVLALLLISSPAFVAAADWPMYRGDAGRTGFTAESLPARIVPQWIYRSPHKPASAWPRDVRMDFDRAFHVVVANGTLYFGSSVDDQIYALDAKTGRTRWTFFTDGPVRFAPVLWKDKLFAVSDDGFLYCLNAADGKLLRKWRGGPNDDKVLGNGRIVSRWPARGGPTIKDGILYWAAGIWQSEKIYIRAMNPETGKVLWTNDTSGGIRMAQPHGGAVAKSGVSAQGYLVANDAQLFVPTGRAVPAAFDRKTGKFQYYHLQRNGHTGGTAAVAIGKFTYNGGVGFVAANGAARTKLGAGQVAAFAEGILHSNGSRLLALKQIRRDRKDRKGKKVTVDDHAKLWQLAKIPGGKSLIVAGNTAIVGGNKIVTLVNLKTKKVIKTLKVDGIAHGLAIADGRLYVSTDTGSIHCFGTGPAVRPIAHDIPIPAFNEKVILAAKEVLAKSKITAGYCVDLGCGDGLLALDLARRSKLHVVAIDSDPKKVAAARAMLKKTGLYGSRVTVHLGDPKKTGLPKYFANLVVCGRSVSQGTAALDEKEAKRLQRPYGGVICVGKPGTMKPQVRGPLAKAGSWSHLYSNPANTACSTDEIKGPLTMLWYRDVDLNLPQRHGRGPSPLFHQGRLFAEGIDEIRAVDAYNGRTIWKFPLKGILAPYNADHIVGTSQTGSNFCAAGDSVYVRQDGHCYRLDAATGKVLGKFTAPKQKDGKPGRWGYIACTDGVLYGSVVNEKHIVRHAWRRADAQMKRLFTESHFLFALDAKTGKLLWRYDAEKSIRNNAIAIGDGRVFLIDRAVAKDDLLSRAARRRGAKAPKKVGHPTGKLVVLDAKTGKQKWTNSKDIFGTMLAFSHTYDVVLMCYQSTRFRLPSEVGGRMAVFRATEGYRLWDKKMKYATRPIVNDRTIYAQGGAWDLLAGKEKPFKFKRYYGCGQISASKNLLLFRSGTIGYKDLSRNVGVENFGGVRPGCWINALPAGGLVFVPDASAGCRCSYQNRSWVALQGKE